MCKILNVFYIMYFSFPCNSVGKEYVCNAGDPGSIPGPGRSSGEGIGFPLQYSWASLVTQLVESACNVGGLDSIPGLERSPGEGKGYPLLYAGLESSMDLQTVRHDWATFTTFELLVHSSFLLHAVQKIDSLRWIQATGCWNLISWETPNKTTRFPSCL